MLRGAERASDVSWTGAELIPQHFLCHSHFHAPLTSQEQLVSWDFFPFNHRFETFPVTTAFINKPDSTPDKTSFLVLLASATSL